VSHSTPTPETADAPELVTLGAHRVTLAPPPAFYLLDLLIAEGQTPAQARALGAAALALCWPEGVRWPAPRRPFIRRDVAMESLGEEVFGALCAAGLPLIDVLRACTAASVHVSRSLTSRAEVQAAEGFSGGPASAAPSGPT